MHRKRKGDPAGSGSPSCRKLRGNRLSRGKFYRKHLSRRLGQTLLRDSNIIEKIADSADIRSGDTVIEIGGGTGNLTRALLKRPLEKLLVFEVDPELADVLIEMTVHDDRCSVHVQDFLESDPEMIFDSCGGRHIKVVSNVPYSISTPVITFLLEHKHFYDLMILTFQREFARRLTARPATKEYGALTLFGRYHAEIHLLFQIDRRCFFPVPAVESAVIRVVPRIRPEFEVVDESLLFAVIRAAFAGRRKMLRNALRYLPDALFSGEETADLERATGADLSRRGETMTLEEFVGLAAAIARRTAQHGKPEYG